MYTYRTFSGVTAIDQDIKKLIVRRQMPGLKWWKRKHDKFPPHDMEWEKYINTQNGLLDGPEARFFIVLVSLYDTGGIYLDLTTMMLGPLPEVCILYSIPPAA